jgi:uncharacterized phage-associated protein
MARLISMRIEAKQLARAILTRSKELGVTVGKTKLLKLMYLADIEHFRETDDTLSGLPWIFYLYGPWSPEYDSLLEQLETEGAILRTPFVGGGIEGEQLSISDELDLAKVIAPAGEYFRTKHLVDTWLDRATAQLLDFVYFETEPMQGARKQAQLDFSKVSKEAPSLYRRTRGTADIRQTEAMRARLSAAAKRVNTNASNTLAQVDVQYGEDFIEALAVLSSSTAE